MIGLDIIGTENVVKYIETSKLTKFTIDANKSGHFICVFECINSSSNEVAINEFSKWADFINPNQTYRITLFDVVDQSIDEQSGILKTKKTRNKSNKMQATFILNESYNAARGNNQQIAAPIDEESLMKKLTSRIVEEQTNNSILNEIRNLSERLNKMELEELEEEEEESVNGIAGINSNQVEQIMGLINLFKSQTQKPQINGIDENPTNEEFKNNINKALRTLHKYDPLLDQDLLKLANLAETKNETFKMLLSTLRSM
jgi:hypothetical protein